MSNTSTYICLGVTAIAVILVYMALKSDFKSEIDDLKKLLQQCMQQPTKQQIVYVQPRNDQDPRTYQQPQVVSNPRNQVVHNGPVDTPKKPTRAVTPKQELVQETPKPIEDDQPGLENIPAKPVTLENIIEDYESESNIVKRESPQIKDYDTIDSYQSKTVSKNKSRLSTTGGKKSKKKRKDVVKDDEEDILTVDTETKQNSDELDNIRDKLKKIKESSDDEVSDNEEPIQNEPEPEEEEEEESEKQPKKKGKTKETVSKQLQKVVKNAPAKRGRGRPRKNN